MSGGVRTLGAAPKPVKELLMIFVGDDERITMYPTIDTSLLCIRVALILYTLCMKMLSLQLNITVGLMIVVLTTPIRNIPLPLLCATSALVKTVLLVSTNLIPRILCIAFGLMIVLLVAINKLIPA